MLYHAEHCSNLLELAGDIGGNPMIRVSLPPSPHVIKIDIQDLTFLRFGKWSFRQQGRTVYVRMKTGRTWVYLHRLVIGASDGQIVDHIDGNGLNNCRKNLRFVTRQQNAWNVHTSGSIGVTKKKNGWRARIRIDGQRVELGNFVDQITAAAVYDYFAILSRGKHTK